MIEDSKYKEILDRGLTLDHFLVLCNIRNGIPVLRNKRTQGFINLLSKKGYITEDRLTELGLEMVENCVEQPVIAIEEASIHKKRDVREFTVSLHSKCQEKLIELTGKKQYMAKVTEKSKSYSFLPNIEDLSKALTKVVVLYKITDLLKVEKTILGYIDKCSRENDWFPVLGYYIIKNNESKLVTDMDSIEDDDMGPSSSSSLQKFV